ncbi:metallophosphoesterase [Candidatus Bipolaricaulota bacterium]|nr:metallophosphoesterase [Candidatus Bipolaricaulota bacterium]
MTRKSLGAILIVLVAWITSLATPITVLYTNDVHMRWDRFASMSDIIAAERAGDIPVLLFDAGDTWQDHRQAIPNVWGSNEAIDWMNAMSYTAMALGNHDTYFGAEKLSKMISSAAFPVLSGNWQRLDNAVADTESSILVQIEDVKILVIGLTTPEFLPIPAFPGWRYLDPVAVVHDLLQRYAGDYNVVFVVGHISLYHARRIAWQVPEIDLFISGHSHQRTPQPMIEGSTLIVQSGAFGQAVGRLQLDIDVGAGEVNVLGHDLIATERTPVDVRAGVRQLVRVLTVIACAITVWYL